MLVLASASPRRRELLAQVGYRFTIHPAQIPEDPLPRESPEGYVTRLAQEKAEAVYRELMAANECTNKESLDGQSCLTVLGADTTVTLDDAILGKPADAADAARMLRMLAGRKHRVMTGVAVVSAAGTKAAAETTEVEFLAMSEAEIAAYIASGEPMDKAGAYGIQGRAARWIPRVDGCYFNVMGLPLALVCRLLGPAEALQ
jgi:septum formation protein